MSQHCTQVLGTLRDVARACAGEIDARWGDVAFSGVGTDTRTLAPGELFVALAGPKHDGHDFLDAAARGGAAGAVVSRADAAPEGLPVVVVAHTLRALGRLATWYRERLPAKVVAITGSTGKTTTRDMLGGILALVGSTVVPDGNENNEIGVPRTLLRLTDEHRFCVLELAMRAPGEIGYLAGIAKPDVGVITNIGQSHVGRLGTREAIAQTKAELLEHIPPQGTAVLNADDFFFSVLSAMALSPVVSFGLAPETQFRAESISDEELDSASFRLLTPGGSADVRLRVPGRHNVLNALAATAAAAGLGVGMGPIVAGLEAYEGASMRLEQVPGRNGAIVINDAYNASPDSVAAALAVLRAASGRRIFVFGDMLELGQEGVRAHRFIGARAAEAGVDWLVSVGELAALAAEEARSRGLRAESVGSPSEAAELLAPELGPGDCVLVKASRGMHLEDVVEALADDR